MKRAQEHRPFLNFLKHTHTHKYTYTYSHIINKDPQLN